MIGESVSGYGASNAFSFMVRVSKTGVELDGDVYEKARRRWCVGDLGCGWGFCRSRRLQIGDEGSFCDRVRIR